MLKLSKIDMREATRLTREGRLKEALDILRGLAPEERPSSAERAPHSLDMAPPAEPGGAWTSPAGGEPERGRLGTLEQTLRGILDGVEPVGSLPDFPEVLHRGRPPAPPLPEGATFAEHSFSGEAGSRTYKLYVPSRYRGQSLPLIVMLHGCTQSPDDFAAGTRMNEVAEEETFLVVYPAQPKSANAQKCWNWFRREDQGRDRGEPSIVAGITREVMRDYAVDRERVYAAGLSAGGAAAAVLAASYPDLYAAIGVHSGLPCGIAHDVPSAFAAMRNGAGAAPVRDVAVPTIVFHGDQDTIVAPANADAIVGKGSRSTSLRTEVERGRSTGGISYTRTVHVDDLGSTPREQWVLHGVGHAWSGGGLAGSYTDPRGPDASREMVRFFLQHRLRKT